MRDRLPVAVPLKQELLAIHRRGHVDGDHQLQVDRELPAARLPGRRLRYQKQQRESERRFEHLPHHSLIEVGGGILSARIRNCMLQPKIEMFLEAVLPRRRLL